MHSRLTNFLFVALLIAGTPQADAVELTVSIVPRWSGKPLVLGEARLTNAAGTTMSVTRLAMLLSHAKLQRVDGNWIGANDWVSYLDIGKGRLAFILNGIPPGHFSALRFDIGLDERTDSVPPGRRPAGHPLHPDVNGLHWSWRGQYVFFAIEGRYRQADGMLGGYSYHLGGQACRGTVEVPLDLDLRQDMRVVLALDAERVFTGQSPIQIAAADSTHSAEGDALAPRLADNAVTAFALLRVEPGPPRNSAATPAPVPGVPAFLAGQVPAHFPMAEWPTDNALSEAGIALGRTLFHDSRLSINNRQSCANCHQAAQAFADTGPYSIGAEGTAGLRNAMPLFNLAWKPSYFWDGRSPTLRDQVLRPIQDPAEMHETLDHVATKLGPLAPRFQQVFGTPEITGDHIAKALEQFLLSRISAGSKLDHTLTAGAKLSGLEQRGFELFFTESDPARSIRGADCFHCHGGAHFTNYQFMNNGLDDDTRRADRGLASHTERPEDEGRFMVPSLRNIALTAPYMHDGRLRTLEEVIEHYDHGVKRSATLDPNLAKHLHHNGLQLDTGDKAALLAFLHTLTDEGFAESNSRPSMP